MSREDAEAIRGSFEAFARGGIDALAEYWHPDIDWRAIEWAPDDVGVMHGAAAMRRYLQEWVDMFDDIVFTVGEMHDLGDGRVVAEQQLAGRAKLSGATTELTYAVVYTMRGGKCVRGREYRTLDEARAAGGAEASSGDLEVVRRLLDAHGELENALPLLDTDVEWIPLRAKTEGAYRGHEGFERFVADTEASFETFEAHFELEELHDGRVLAWGTIHVHGRGSGVEMDVPSGGLFELRDGKVARWEDFGSREQALDAAGVRE